MTNMSANIATGRLASLFARDIGALESTLSSVVARSRFLVIGGAGTIGQATAKEIFKRNPAGLTVVDISENNLVELVRDLRSSEGYGSGDFETFAIDCGSEEFQSMVASKSKKFDFVLNFSALKHVRSESDPFTLMRLVRTNVLNMISTYRLARDNGCQKFFCVSTDKATNPVNMMGASKRIMELFMAREAVGTPVSMARFANVAFSDGSLLHGFNQRLEKAQPISAPSDVRRYFVSKQESGELCLLSSILGESLDVFFPMLSEDLNLVRFSDIARSYVESRGYEVYECESENEARDRASELISKKMWPCYFFESDTTGEKDFEEFYTGDEKIDWSRFETIAVIKSATSYEERSLYEFEEGCQKLLRRGVWEKADLLKLFSLVIPDFAHLETGKYLDQRM